MVVVGGVVLADVMVMVVVSDSGRAEVVVAVVIVGRTNV